MSNLIFLLLLWVKIFLQFRIRLYTIKKMNLLHGIRLNNFHNISTPSVIFITPCLQEYGIHYPKIPRNMRLLQKMRYIPHFSQNSSNIIMHANLDYTPFMSFYLSFWRVFLVPFIYHIKKPRLHLSSFFLSFFFFKFCFDYFNKCPIIHILIDFW